MHPKYESRPVSAALIFIIAVSRLEVCRSTILASRHVPVADNAYPYPYLTRAKNVYLSRPDPTRGYNRTSSTISRYSRLPLPLPLHCNKRFTLCCCMHHHDLCLYQL